MERAATVVRQTKETNIELTLGLDGGEVVVDTGVGFFDHMLTALAVHGGFGLRLKAEGDWNVGLPPHGGRYRHRARPCV